MTPKEMESAHERDVDACAQCVKYRDVRSAQRYIDRHISPVWCEALGIESCDDVDIVAELDLTPTMVLLVQLFGIGVLGHRITLYRGVPRIRNWRPILDKESRLVRVPRAISKNDIARVIGRSRSAVDEAVMRFRANNARYKRYQVLFDKRLALPLYVETGIMLDIMTSMQLTFGLHLEDYESAQNAAELSRINDMDTNIKQRLWCGEAKMSHAKTRPVDTARTVAQRFVS